MSKLELLLGYWQIWILFPAYFLAIGVAIVRWKNHPFVSLFAIAAFATFFFVSVVRLAVLYWVSLEVAGGGSAYDAGYVSGLLESVLWIPHWAAELALIVAIFGWRNEANADRQAS